MARQPRKLSPAQVEAFDHDDNGEAGGSKRRKLTEHELAAICAEAFEAYDYQDERIRFDTLGRRWQFRPDKVGHGESVLTLEVLLLETVRTDRISAALLASDIGREMVADVVARMSEGL